MASQALKEAVEAGDLATARDLCGAPYAVEGEVVHGFHRGASIGVPTANLRVRGMVLPPDGVYAVCVSGECSGVGVANLGRNPTFGNDERSLETHIFDFEGDLYGKRISVGFVRRLRGERKFDGVDELVAQIRRDIDAARAVHAEEQ
jgi:riboflavin kinase/FMN adenylyltransferase